MSVLSFPRLYFRGLVSWDPGLTNNNETVYDGADVKIILPPGVTFDTFKQWVIDNDSANWNYYGTHTCEFLPGQTLITGGALNSSDPLITIDPVVGKPVQLQGKLVDLDPAAVLSSQIYFDEFSFGDGQAGARGERFHRMHSRWINFRRNLGGLPIAGNAAVVWQTVFPREKLQLFNPANSELLKALEQAIAQEGAQGLMVRFCTYRTLYFQNGILNDIPQQPRSTAELHDLYRQGLMFSNPAYSLVTGVMGVWKNGELASVPGGRYLAPSALVKPGNVAAPTPVRLGPCVAELDRATSVLSLDLNSTIPEIDMSVTKADFGPLTVAVRQGDVVETIATLEPARYAREAYETRAGIVDIPITSDQADKIEAGQLILQVQQVGQTVAALTETEFAAQADERDNYLNQDLPQNLTLHVSRRGKAAPEGTLVLIARYDSSGRRLAAGVAPPQVLTVGADGKVNMNLVPQAPGFINISLLPFAPDAPQPVAPEQLDIMAAFFLCVRTLPFDDQLAAQTPDSQLTWQFIYENILRVYDLLNPVMSSPDIGLSLSDASVWTTPGKAKLLKRVTTDSSFEFFNHMPITRELSAGKQKLLHRFCDLVINGALPSDTLTVAILEQPELVPSFDFRRDFSSAAKFRTISELMRVPREEHDVNWLKESLQAAVTLEFATVPVYLCGMWSIKNEDPAEPVFAAIRGIVIDEMFHMALACNMLTTVGGTPEINTEKALPVYPGPLPGGVRPGLRVALTGLTKDVVEKIYMQIEYPENGPIALFRGETFPTIGDFYDAILEAFQKLTAAQITGARQLTRGSRLFSIKTIADVEKAITIIKRQGEGTSQSPFSDDFGTQLAHYYKFAEIYHERKLKKNAAGQWKYEGDPIPFPEVYPMAEVPPGGYSESGEFDVRFTNMLNLLQQAWFTGNGDYLSKAVTAMFQLEAPARKLMQTPIEGGSGNYGPDFRLKH